MLEIGIKHEFRQLVDETNTASAFRSGLLDVFATPAMIALMEYTSYKSVEPYLGEGQGTVGTLVDVKHLAATPIGLQVTCKSELVEVDRRRLRFRVECIDETGETIGEGFHERFIIDSDKFMEKCDAKRAK